MNTRPIQERFFEKVAKCDSGCHEWQGCIMPNGYGQVRHEGKTAYAHRVAYLLAHGDPGAAYVLHKCDNRRCVNPEHLFLGSFQDNMDDMTAKLRHAHGERNAHAKLTAQQVREIRAMSGTQKAAAEKYGVTPSLIGMIRKRRIWKYV